MRAGDVVPVLCARGCADDTVPVLRARGLSTRDGPLACSAASRLSPEKSLSLLGVERSLVVMRAGDVVRVLCARGCADDADPALCARGLSTRDGPLACSRLSTWLAPTCASERHPLLGVPGVFLLLIVAVFDAQVGASVGSPPARRVPEPAKRTTAQVLRSQASRAAAHTARTTATKEMSRGPTKSAKRTPTSSARRPALSRLAITCPGCPARAMAEALGDTDGVGPACNKATDSNRRATSPPPPHAR